MYYVYAGYSGDQLMYIGKGKENRDSHLNSGCSHVYEANKFHFSGGVLEVVRIADHLEELDALELEAFVILEASPLWNSASTGNTYKRSESTSKYLGVSLMNKRGKRWRAFCKVDRSKVHIGYYDTEIEAAKARDQYMIDNQICGKLNAL